MPNKMLKLITEHMAVEYCALCTSTPYTICTTRYYAGISASERENFEVQVNGAVEAKTG